MYNPKTETELAEFLAGFRFDPYGFVMAAYPWGEPTLPDGSRNPLRNRKGPEDWQRDLLVALGNHMRENNGRVQVGLWMEIWRSAIASGHGVGKSAEVAWLIQFFMSTRKNVRGAVTASTQHQLEDKTWPELAKWHKLLINRHWFVWTATTYSFAAYPAEEQKNYRFTAATVSEHNTEAFAGLHNEEGTVVVIFDEASGVASGIWQVAQGALSDGEAFFLAFGNPTKPLGDFADCFDKFGDMYFTRNIDARLVSHVNKQWAADLLRLCGGDEDHDEFKIRVRGMFPQQSYNGFISIDAVNDAAQRELTSDSGAALIMAIDVARFGGDEIVFGFRQGRDARSRRMTTFKGLSTTKTVEIALKLIAQHQPDVVVIESTGPGAGVIDMLRDRGIKVVEVHPGAKPHEPEHYFNRRAEIWSLMRDAINEWLCLYEDPVLVEQLTKIQYTLDRHEQRTKLEAKEEYMSRTGLSSPDRADTLALTFAVNIARRDSNLSRLASAERNTAVSEYDPITY